MDLISLNKNAILVPTPGQSEQEYLAIHLKNNGLFHFVKQKDLKLNDVLKNANEKKQNVINLPEVNYSIIDNWINHL
jgi:hypothetical protein